MAIEPTAETIASLRAQGYTLQAIGDLYGLTESAVCQRQRRDSGQTRRRPCAFSPTGKHEIKPMHERCRWCALRPSF